MGQGSSSWRCSALRTWAGGCSWGRDPRARACPLKKVLKAGGLAPCLKHPVRAILQPLIPFDEIAAGATARLVVIQNVQYLSSRDVIMHISGQNNKGASKIWERLPASRKEELSTECRTWKFPGAGQVEQVVISFKGILKVKLSQSELISLGQELKKIYVEKHGKPPSKHSQLCGGRATLVNTYMESDRPLVEEVLRRHVGGSA